MIRPFSFSRTPQIVFGAGSSAKLPALASRYGRRVLLLSGPHWLAASGRLEELTAGLTAAGVQTHTATISGEPSPEAIDQIAAAHRPAGIAAVIAIGGGSVVDAGKAVAAMLTVDAPVVEFLEDVGSRQHPGTTVPLIAVPTTAGTGSEATKNAVLSSVGPNGFKKSLRHDNFIPAIAVIDPTLSLSCPRPVTAACGMDAFCQLLESYVSTQASVMTDALALEGLRLAGANLIAVCSQGANDVAARGAMAWAACLSGMTLANAGLGVIHGLAGVIGGLWSAPHGALCGTLLVPAMRLTIDRLRTGGPEGNWALEKFATAGRIVAGTRGQQRDGDAIAALLETLARWTEALEIPPLTAYGITAADCDAILKAAGSKNNPVKLDKEEMRGILLARITL
jgi:alcohol dehydrogenase class IV